MADQQLHNSRVHNVPRPPEPESDLTVIDMEATTRRFRDVFFLSTFIALVMIFIMNAIAANYQFRVWHIILWCPTLYTLIRLNELIALPPLEGFNLYHPDSELIIEASDIVNFRIKNDPNILWSDSSIEAYLLLVWFGVNGMETDVSIVWFVQRCGVMLWLAYSSNTWYFAISFCWSLLRNEGYTGVWKQLFNSFGQWRL